ncbi:unnamed protein product [Boreogadus saida]
MLVRLQEPSTSSAIQETDGLTDGMTHRDASTQGKYAFMEDHIFADDIAERFRVSQSVVSRIISQWLDFMEEKMSIWWEMQ